MKNWMPALGAVLVLFCIDAPVAHAGAIKLGSRIDLSPTTFAMPLVIEDGSGVTEWFFDLTYDPTDVQVNVGCDPFSGDIYCSLFTGPVTEGDFFAAGAPFNLLLPGFVELDPVTLGQAGRLFGLHGAYGGTAPGPSGNGVLAYIEFLVLGTGDSPIDGEGTVDGDVVSVPEPGALGMFATALGLLVALRFRRHAAVRGACASLLVCGAAQAQFGPSIELPTLPPVVVAPVAYPATVAPTAAGTYFAQPVWSQTLAPNVRFVVLSNFNSHAVLDRETGLVWTRHYLGRTSARGANCRSVVVGNHSGWRLPAVSELQTLIDTSIPSQPDLPSGHPFVLPNGRGYWASEIEDVGGIKARRFVFMQSGYTGLRALYLNEELEENLLCVRGGQE